MNNKPRRCCCGHACSAHVRYMGGVNRKGSPFVCTKDNCNWSDCDLEEEPDTSETVAHVGAHDPRGGQGE